MNDKDFNRRLRQILFLVLLLTLTIVVVESLYIYLPGMLGATTLYILSRENYFQLTYKKKWKKGTAAFLFILYYSLLLGLPVFLAITLLSPKIEGLINNQQQLLSGAKHVLDVVQNKVGFKLVDDKAIGSAAGKLSSILPSLFSSTATLVTNLVIMLFLLYYMLYSGSVIERFLARVIPLKDENIRLLAIETKTTIKSNAIGIPVIALIQGATAALGYFIFGVQDVLLWGFLTGVFSFLPVIGSMIIWVPICIYLFASGNTGTGIGLLLYSAIVTSNIDYFARLSIMKRLGDVHPVITLFGIIVGLSLFGFIGLIFGPLMVNYIIVLFDIYMNEFVEEQPGEVPDIAEEDSGEKSDSK
jgi:predicted PurR-regulated permease PerM